MSQHTPFTSPTPNYAAFCSSTNNPPPPAPRHHHHHQPTLSSASCCFCFCASSCFCSLASFASSLSPSFANFCARSSFLISSSSPTPTPPAVLMPPLPLPPAAALPPDVGLLVPPCYMDVVGGGGTTKSQQKQGAGKGSIQCELQQANKQTRCCRWRCADCPRVTATARQHCSAACSAAATRHPASCRRAMPHQRTTPTHCRISASP